MPLALHALLQLGCVCKVDSKAQNRTIEDGWSLNDLHMKTTTECSYFKEDLPYIFLYHSWMDNRGLYALYTPKTSRILVVVVNPFNNREVDIAQLERQFRDAVRNQSQSSLDTSELTCKVEYVSSNADAGRLLQRTLIEYRDQHRGATLAVVECPNVDTIKTSISALSEFPCIQVACNALDSHYQTLGWQPVPGTVAMQRCAASSVWLQERMTLARYAHVPLGNFNSDQLLFTADTFFARALRDHQQVLWVSHDGVPDLGGVPEEEPSFADEAQEAQEEIDAAYKAKHSAKGRKSKFQQTCPEKTTCSQSQVADPEENSYDLVDSK
ncbi:hypothetical protein M758_UG221700 [Ceratodon purpureus]|nr:hypothetical protein M758_UG221700 [Ceratodon purpureus]